MGYSNQDHGLPSDVFTARVTKVFDHGIQVETIDDQRGGYIKRREISWERRISASFKIPQIGDLVKVVLLPDEGPEKHVPIPMSMRQVTNPWAEAIAKRQFKIHDIVEGEIVNVLHDRAYAQIEPGIDALIYPKDVPMLREQSLGDVLWLGDRISGQIESISPGRHLEISLTKRLQKMDPTCDGQRELLEEYFGARLHPHALVPDEPALIPEPSTIKIAGFSHPIQHLERILIIDDEEEWLTYLKNGLIDAFNVEVGIVMTGEEAIENIQKGLAYSLILVDLQLHNETGIEVARQIRQLLPDMAILIISVASFDQADQYPDYVYSSKNLDDLIGKINWMRLGVVQELPLRTPVGESLFAQKLGLQAESRRKLQDILNDILAELQKSTQVSYCLLLQQIGERTISIVTTCPAIHEDWVKVMQSNLYYSPARQVIELGQELHESQINFEFDPKFVNFFPLLSPRACFALPVRIPDKAISYGLFLISDQPDTFDSQKDELASKRVQDARIAVQYLSLALERAALLEQMRLYEERYALGQLLGDLVHETNNKLNGLLAHVLSQEKQLSQHPEWQKPHLIPEWFSGLEQEAAKLRSDYDDLKELVDAYARQAKYHYEPVDINNVVEKVARQLAATAKRMGTDIYMSREQPLPQTLGVYSHIQQIVMNLMLNAIQMINYQRNLMKLIGEQTGSGAHLLQTGLVIVQTRGGDKKSACNLEIRVIDTGPGIHWMDRERIFEPGFSRRGGAGLGLNISRNLIERMGGRLDLFDSILFTGSAFVIELPCYPMDEEEP